MIKRIRASWWVVLAALLLSTPFAFSQTVDLYLNDGGNNVMDGVYVGPYDATQSNSNNQNPQGVQIICDDFSHDVVPGESWQASVTSVSSLSANTITNSGLMWANGTLLNGGTGAQNVFQGYMAMAYLASQMLPLSGNPANNQTVGYMAYAIWAIFQGAQVEAWLGGPTSQAWLTVQKMALNALGMTFSAGQFAGWELLTPIAGSQNPFSQGTPQEYFEYVPEGGTALMYLLLASFACFGTMFLKSRRRASQVV